MDLDYMKRLLLVILSVNMLFSFTDDNPEDIDCALFDPASPTLYVKLIDDNGDNLIENGTIDPDSLHVTGDFANVGFNFVPANEYAVPNADIRKFDNTVQLGIPQQTKFQYFIYFGQIDSIRVDVSAKLTEIPCDISYFTPTRVTFMGADDDLSGESSLQFLAELEL